MKAGNLSQRVRVEKKVTTQVNGDVITTWQELATIWASITPLSVKDWILAQQHKSVVNARIQIRFNPKFMTSGLRLIGPGGTIYYPQGILPDPNSGREWLTLPCRVEQAC